MSGGDLEVYEGQEVAIARPPEEVLEEAKTAAVALQRVIEQKPKKVVINGEIYLTFEDWQTLAKFYGLTVGVDSTEYVEFGDVKGWEAAAIVRNGAGVNVSRAEGMCLNDEKKWSTRDNYQLRSMAQTRACAKALRNVLGFVSVLAGYAATPAEEMDGVKSAGNAGAAQPEVQQTGEPQIKNPDDPASDKQLKMIWAIMNGMGYKTDEDKHHHASELLGGPLESFKQLTKGLASELITKLKEQEPPEGA